MEVDGKISSGIGIRNVLSGECKPYSSEPMPYSPGILAQRSEIGILWPVGWFPPFLLETQQLQASVAPERFSLFGRGGKLIAP